jgi:hypothetical protein
MPSRRKTNKKFARINNKTKGLKKGGGIIGSGSYGCVYKPALKCDGELNIDITKVSKLMKRTDTEFKLIEIINTIDPLYLFHLQNHQCSPNTDENNKDEINKCGFNDNNVVVKLLLMDDGGMDLYKFTKKIQPTTLFKTFKNTIKNILPSRVNKKQLYLKEFYSDLLRIFYGIKKIKDNGYIHNDIKMENIMVKINPRNVDLRLNLIDFGLMTKYRKFDIYSIFDLSDDININKFITEFIEKPYYPIDLLYILKKDIHFFVETQNIHYIKLKINNKRVNSIIKLDLNNYSSISIMDTNKNIIQSIIQSIDTYMLGMTMLIFSNKIKLETHINPELSYDLFLLFYGMMSYNYANRKTIEESIERFNDIINHNPKFFNMNKITQIRNDFKNVLTVFPEDSDISPEHNDISDDSSVLYPNSEKSSPTTQININSMINV